MPETLERLHIGDIQCLQPDRGYRFSVDAILLADFIRVKPHDRCLDLGTGCGIIPLLLAVLTPAREIVGLELQKRLACLAQRNVTLNHLEGRVRIVQGDLRQSAQLFPAGRFDVVVSNPPYRKIGAGRLNPHDEQAVARHELTCQLDDLLAACKYLIKPGGKVFLIYLAERLAELFDGLRASRLEPKRLRCVHSFAHTPASLVLVEARRDAADGLRVLPPLYLYTRDNQYTAEAKQILREV